VNPERISTNALFWITGREETRDRIRDGFVRNRKAQPGLRKRPEAINPRVGQ